MANSGKVGFLIFYVSFYLTITFIAANVGSSFGSFGVSESIVSPPQLADPDPVYQDNFFGDIGEAISRFFDYFFYFFAYIGYFFGLQGLTLFGLPSGYAVLISVPLTVGLVWCVLSLARGGD